MMAASPADAQLRVTRLVADHMVVQRDARVPVWGWAAPGTPVTVDFAGRALVDTADVQGRWRVVLPPMKAGGPHSMTIVAGRERVTVRDILVGDVWVASGQSNMEWTVSVARDAEREIAAANDSGIRHFKVPISWSWEPLDTLSGGTWQVATPAHVGGFTAVGYFFARAMRRHGDVPIGILHTSWGGSRIEPWMSREALGYDEAKIAQLMREEEEHQRRTIDTLRARLGGLPQVDSGLVAGRAVWADPALDDAGWRTIRVPARWEERGYPGMDGVAWYRSSFALSEAEARDGIRLGLGTIDDSDISWVNGVEVGRTDRAYAHARLYDVPASALRAGRNVIAVRVEDFGGGGGIYGDSANLFIETAGGRRPLAGTWKFRVGAVSFSPDGQHINKIPTIVHNAMIRPLLPYPIAGALWYQGESNANDVETAVAYRGLFADLITSWRREWASPRRDFPFLWVQLANFMAPDSQPVARAAWPIIRESQSAALRLPNTAQVIAIDVGEADDIHPRDKQSVGERLALAARAVAHGEAVVHSGPVYRRHEVRDGRVVLEFDHLGGGLIARGGGPLRGFAIAGADGRWVWADAVIDGNTVIVSSPRVSRPVAVRYAWGNNPEGANLYNAAGLPAAPFRTDSW